MKHLARAALAAIALSSPSYAQPARPAPLADLIGQVDIPYQQFTLPNGLRVVVHTDRKAPIVAVSVWYHVGSKDEPKGEDGFAHLFEHLMFNGSENAPGDFFAPLREVGATDLNGSTWFDRTNYFETVPTPALPLALFLESDRMGHLLGAIDQTTLDRQRGVVENEKRQGDNQPYGLVEYAQVAALASADHPYGHATIGSVTDLDAATLDTVKNWFRLKYGPNNAVLVLAGDIDVAAARPLVERYFGDIPRGPNVVPAAADIPTLPARKDQTITDRVAVTRLYRNWYVPGLTSADLPPLDIGATVLGGLSSSRLDNILVRGEKLAVSVSASIQPFERLSWFEVTVDVRPGVDAAMVSRRLDAILADYIANGPTADEVQRAVTREVAGRIGGLEAVGGGGGKAVTLAEGMLYADDPGFYKAQLATYAALTPAAVTAVDAKWLSRPVFALTVAPGARKAYDQSVGGKAGGALAPSYYRTPAADEMPLAPPAKLTAPLAFQPAGVAPGAGTVAPPQNPARPARVPPNVGQIADLAFPKIEHATLSNGIKVDYARATTLPLTRVSIAFDAGVAADPKDKLGLQAMLLSLLDEGTTTRNSIQIAEEEERLGASISAGASMDRTSIGLSALTPNLAPSLDLLADIVRNPAFAPAEIERLRAQNLAGIAAEMTQPQAIGLRMLPPLLYGKGHPYGVPFTGSGDPAVVARVTRDDMLGFLHTWLRPDNARIAIVSDRPLAELLPLLDQRFGHWQATGAKGVKHLDAPIAPAGAARILLVDQPDSPQSLVMAGEVTRLRGGDDLTAIDTANDVLGGNFLSRLNMDLRETKHFTYGISSALPSEVGPMPFLIIAPVQADKTGESIAAIRADLADLLGTKGITTAELAQAVNGNIRELPGSFATSGAVLGGIQRNAVFGRPDDYYDTLASRYRALDTAKADAALRAAIDPAKLLWVVIGDAKAVRPQLEKLGMPIEVVAAPGKAPLGKGK